MVSKIKKENKKKEKNHQKLLQKKWKVFERKKSKKLSQILRHKINSLFIKLYINCKNSL